MARPIIIAHHLIWTVYGWWLPNDPRGSGSQHIACDVIAQLGQLHFGRKGVQPAAVDVRRFYEQAKHVLKYELITLSPAAFAVIGEAFAETIKTQQYTCYACAVMPDHVHILVRKHKHTAEQMIENLKSASRLSKMRLGVRLSNTGLFPTDHPFWTGGRGWKVFLDHPGEVERTIGYIDSNPMQMRMPRQTWPFITAYDRWPLHPGHSPNSPYVKRLKAAGRYP